MDILRRIERYLRRSGTSATRFGREALRDPRLVKDLRNGRRLGRSARERVTAYLERGEAALLEAPWKG